MVTILSFVGRRTIGGRILGTEAGRELQVSEMPVPDQKRIISYVISQSIGRTDVMADLHGTTLTHATSLRLAYDMT